MNRSAFRKAVLKLCAAALFLAATPVRSQIPPPTRPLPNLSLVCVGVSRYLDPSNTLLCPAQDARDVAALFQKQAGKLFQKVTVVMLTDQQARRDAIISTLVAMRRQRAQMGPDDYTLLFVCGHGTNDDLGQYFFAPYEIDPDNIDATGVEWLRFSQTLAQLPGHVLFFLDTARSGGASAPPNAAFFAACGEAEVSQESRNWGHGAFTKAMLEGLGGRADSNHDGVVTLMELAEYTRKRVADLTKGAQHPVFTRPSAESADLPLAIISPEHS